MRLIITTLLFWFLFVSTAAADVIFDKELFPYRPAGPRRRIEVPLPSPPAPIVEPDESWHPNAEPDPETEPGTTPEEAGFAIVIIGAVILGLSVRENRRRPLQRRSA